MVRVIMCVRWPANPPSGVVQLRSIVIGYPVASSSDASKFDDAEFETTFVNARYPMPLS